MLTTFVPDGQALALKNFPLSLPQCGMLVINLTSLLVLLGVWGLGVDGDVGDHQVVGALL